MTARLADLAWPEVAERAAAGAMLAVPLGSTEQHGPHLPLSTDTDIAVALCERLAAARPDVLIAPAVAYGSSGEHAGFAGTLSIGQDATELLVWSWGGRRPRPSGTCCSCPRTAATPRPVARAVRKLRSRSRDVTVFQPAWHGDPHAGHQETAIQLVLRREAVRMDRAAPGNTQPLAALMPTLSTGGVRAVSPSGVLGDPTTATETDGAALLAELGGALVRQVAAGCPA